MLRRNAPIEVDLAGLTIEPDVAEVRKLFDFLEFRALTDRLFEALGTPASQQPSMELQVLEAEIADATDASAAVSMIGCQAPGIESWLLVGAAMLAVGVVLSIWARLRAGRRADRL